MNITKDCCPICGSTAVLRESDECIHCLHCNIHIHCLDDRDPEVPPGIFNQRKVLRNFTCVMGRLPQVEVVKRQYTTGDIALYIETEFHGCRETVMVASCLIPGVPEGFAAIKTWSENEGCLRELTNAGAIDEPDFFIAGIPICRLLF